MFLNHEKFSKQEEPKSYLITLDGIQYIYNITNNMDIVLDKILGDGFELTMGEESE